ncbi:aminoglycoside phosphotransferase [Marmoricola sp. RAF53]|uniref:aminoglycoside phosphotransferase n=1 Tax=Marmoricola sp. RAF53 TaxID=3233059 RepID=UPI003F956F41
MPETPLVHDSVETLLAGVTESELMETSGKSGAVLERVVIDGHEFVVKYLDAAGDWTMRAAGVPGGATLAVWERGLLDALPDCFHQPIVGLASDDGLTTLLMHDVTAWIVPATDDVVPLAQHEGFLDHMAALHARFWQSSGDIDVVSPHRRYLELSPSMARTEAELGSEALVPRLVAQGWPLLAEVAPRAAAVVLPLAHDPGPLVAALAPTPQTFVHGNWKLDNIGTDDEGRTVLLDWEVPGRAAALSDLAWYLAINCRRIPTSKEQALLTYRDALERHGISTEGWWETQEALALLGALVLFGWEKALGGYDDELAWWEDRALRAAPLLGA